MNHERADDGLGKAPERKEAKNASLLDKILAMLPTFIVTGVLGTILAAWFQERGWAWQEAVHQVEKDTASAMDSLPVGVGSFEPALVGGLKDGSSNRRPGYRRRRKGKRKFTLSQS